MYRDEETSLCGIDPSRKKALSFVFLGCSQVNIRLEVYFPNYDLVMGIRLSKCFFHCFFGMRGSRAACCAGEILHNQDIYHRLVFSLTKMTE